MVMPVELACLVPLLPLVGGLAVGLFGRRLGEDGARGGVLAVALALLGAVWLLAAVVERGPSTVFLLPGVAEGGPLRIALHLDRLSAVMMVLITGVSAIVHLYSLRYLQGEEGYARFFCLLGLTTSLLLWLVTSPNLLMLFLCWHGLSWLLYLLLAFNRRSAPAQHTARKALAVHVVGDLAFLAGLLVAYGRYGTLDFDELFARAAQAGTVVLPPGGWAEVPTAALVTGLIFIAAVAKSAQVPLHVWLPDTMDTPTPVSALMHAGIVNAGGFLLNRLAPLYVESPGTLHLVFLVGGATAIVGAAIMLTQSDVKKTLGFSTMGQMGYMVMECGLGAFALAVFHLVAHGLFKATLFLNAGQAIHAARREPKLPPSATVTTPAAFSPLAWGTGVAVTLLLPLVIVLAAHGVLRVPLRDAQGAVIFLFFGWVTASQAVISLSRLRAVESWKIAGTMLLALGLIVVTYLWAGEAFTYFLYPDPALVASYYGAAALPGRLFDLLVGATALLIVAGWGLIYAYAHGQRLWRPSWLPLLEARLYVLFLNRLYLDAWYRRVGKGVTRFLQRVAAGL
jgi:NADH-quinone oxidoreductase subunit L